MKIALGSDHRGYALKSALIAYLEAQGHETLDCGAFSEESFDYPVSVSGVAENMLSLDAERGILICYTGIGSAICANKFPGIRAALCHDVNGVQLTRQHNNANVLVLGSLYVDEELAKKMTEAFVSTDFDGGRHQRRVDMIGDVEKKYSK